MQLDATETHQHIVRVHQPPAHPRRTVRLDQQDDLVAHRQPTAATLAPTLAPTDTLLVRPCKCMQVRVVKRPRDDLPGGPREGRPARGAVHLVAPVDSVDVGVARRALSTLGLNDGD